MTGQTRLSVVLDSLDPYTGLVERRDGPDEDAPHTGAELGVEGAEEPQAVRQREHPMR